MKTMIAAWVNVELAQAIYDHAAIKDISRSAAIAEALATYCNRPELAATPVDEAKRAAEQQADAFLREHPELSIRVAREALAKQGLVRGKNWVHERRLALASKENAPAAR